jgi:hypothetical protein
MEVVAMLAEWLRRITDFEAEPGLTGGISYDQAGTPASLSVRCAMI